MRALPKVLRFAGRHSKLLVRCFLLLVRFRWTLWRRSYRPLLDEIRALSGTETRPINPDILAWAVASAAWFVPWASCLTQSLVLRYMLARCGHHAVIKIGGKTEKDGSFDAHAWVIHDGRLLIGGPEERISGFKIFVDL